MYRSKQGVPEFTREKEFDVIGMRARRKSYIARPLEEGRNVRSEKQLLM